MYAGLAVMELDIKIPVFPYPDISARVHLEVNFPGWSALLFSLFHLLTFGLERA